MELTTRNVNTAFAALVEGSSRAGAVTHLEEPFMLTYTHPRERVLLNPARDANPFFHLYEALWMLAGRNDVAPLAHYNSRIGDFSDDSKTLNGSYGYRWRQAHHYPRDADVDDDHVLTDQINLLVNHLKDDPHSRRAVLQMWTVEDDLLKIGGPGASRDVCCNTCAYFAVEFSPCRRCSGEGVIERSAVGGGPFPVCPACGGKPHDQPRWLNMTVCNRSNDLVWGLLGANACLSGDTVVTSPEGDISLMDLSTKFETGDVVRYPVFSFNPDTKDMSLSWCNRVWRTGARAVLELEFDDGTFLRVTGDHKLFRKKWNNSTFCEETRADQLQVGDRVWATTVWRTKDGRNHVKKNLACDTRYSNMTKVSRAYYELVHGPIPDGNDIHHENEIKDDDRLDNLRVIPKGEHARHHVKKNHPMSSVTARRKASESRKRYFSRMTADERDAYAAARRGKTPTAAARRKMSNAQKARWNNMSAEERSAEIAKIQSAGKGVPCRRFTGKKHSAETKAKMAKALREAWAKRKKGLDNHKIVGIRQLPPEDVYDFSVPGNHNAMLDNGVFVHNCHFSVLQEYMAARLGLEVGVYHHFTNNLHAYTERPDWKPAEWLAAERTEYHEPLSDYTLVPLVKDPAAFERELPKVVSFWAGGRESARGIVERRLDGLTEPFLKTVAGPMFSAFGWWREKIPGWDKRIDHACDQIADDGWRAAAREWLERRAEKAAGV